MAGVSTPDASLLVIQPYDQGAIPAIERALMKSDLGLTPSNDGRVIRLQVPQLTAVRACVCSCEGSLADFVFAELIAAARRRTSGSGGEGVI